VAGHHLSVPVRCTRCGQRFIARPSGVRPVSSRSPRLDIGSATSAGKVRTRNEDSFLVQHLTWCSLDDCHEIALLAVADGVGGQEAGDRASGLVVRTAGSVLAPLLGGALSGQFTDATPHALARSVDFALKEANRAVYRAGQRDPACKGMGATAVLVLIWDGRVHVAHVGDCCVYHLHAGQLTRITRDQTVVARMVEVGALTPREAESHPQRHVITQAIGKRFDVQPDLHDLRLMPGDWLVVACDGFPAHVDEPTLRAELLKPGTSATWRAHRLVQLANERGGSDNCTVVAVGCC
jgi:protein phosphatase